MGCSPHPATRLWLTVAEGGLSEVFFPRLDRPALHELRFLVAASGFDAVDDGREAEHHVRSLAPAYGAYEVTSRHAEYELIKQIMPGHDLNAVLISGTFTPDLPDLRLWVQVAPHQNPAGPLNTAQVVETGAGPALVARVGSVDIVVVGPFSSATAGFRGASDLASELVMGEGEPRATYRSAGPGNVSLGAMLTAHAGPFQLAVGFGHSRADAEEAARELLRQGASATRQALEDAWRRDLDMPRRVPQVAADGGELAMASLAVIRSLEDKAERGAFIAAPAAPWGERCHDGHHVYHLVWARDLYQMATALLAVGDLRSPLRALEHLARVQAEDGGWPQNWDLDRRPHWAGRELDQSSYPVLLAWRLRAAGVLESDPWPGLVRSAVINLLNRGPATPLDRWEDAGGISPSTVAAEVAALVCGAELAEAAGETMAANHLRVVADYWADRVEAWCFDPDLRGYVRLAPAPDGPPAEGAAPGLEFLELVRLGVRPAHHPAIRAALVVADRHLRWDGAAGSAWRRYPGDRYGETEAGAPWPGTGSTAGVGRPWPLLAGERGQYEARAGGSAAEMARAMEAFAGPGLMLPEQVWDADPVPGQGLRPGGPTNSASPLGWAHAEYLKLLVAIADASHPDLIEPVTQRYSEPPAEPAFVWSEAHPFTGFTAGRTVRIQLKEPALIRWTSDGWASYKDVTTTDTTLGFHVAEVPTQIMRPGAEMTWTVRYPDRWEGVNRTFRAQLDPV